jgi:hypothetical protein
LAAFPASSRASACGEAHKHSAGWRRRQQVGKVNVARLQRWEMVAGQASRTGAREEAAAAAAAASGEAGSGRAACGRKRRRQRHLWPRVPLAAPTPASQRPPWAARVAMPTDHVVTGAQPGQCTPPGMPNARMTNLLGPLGGGLCELGCRSAGLHARLTRLPVPKCGHYGAREAPLRARLGAGLLLLLVCRGQHGRRPHRPHSPVPLGRGGGGGGAASTRQPHVVCRCCLR